MLRERGLAPKRKADRNNPLVRYSAGHRPQDIAEVGRGIARLASLWIILDRVEVRAKGKKPQIYTEEGRLIELNARLTRTSLINGTTVPVAWTMNVGDALAGQVHSLSPLTPIARKVIGYDPTTDGPSGWASTYSAHAVARGSVVQRQIGTLLENVGLKWDDRKPGRSWESFIEALHRLKIDQVIAAYDFVQRAKPPPIRQAGSERGWELARARNWVEALLASERIVWAPQEPDAWINLSALA